MMILFLLSKYTKLYVLVVTLSEKANQKVSKHLRKGIEISVYWNEYQTKSENKNITNEYRFFPELNFVGIKRLFVLVYSNQDDDAKRFKTQRYYLPKGVIMNNKVIINGKTFYDQPIHFDIKQYGEIRKLTTGQGEVYTTGQGEVYTTSFLDYEYIKNHYGLIAVI